MTIFRGVRKDQAPIKPMSNPFSKFVNMLLGRGPTGGPHKSVINYPVARTGALTPKEIDHISNSLKNGEELNCLPDFYWVLYTHADDEQIPSIGILRNLLATSAANLWKIDSLCRAKTSLEWTFDWSKVSPEILFPKGIVDSDKVWIYGFSSFHPSGFFREKATIGLAGLHSGEEIPFLIIRLNDWVEVVREKAKQSIEDRIAPSSAIHFLKSYPFLKRLENTGRGTHGIIIQKVTAQISLDRKIMDQGLVATDPETRRFSFEIAANSSMFELDDIKEALLREPVGTIRLYALRSVEKKISLPRDISFIHALIDDRFTPVQRLALDILCSRSMENTQNILKEKALSEKSGVRQTARYYLKKGDVADPAEIYRKALVERTGGALIGAIRGIGEVGEKQDADALKAFLQSHGINVLRSAIGSIASLDSEDMLSTLLPFVSDSRPGVSREAAQAVKSRCMEIDLDWLNGLARESSHLHVKKNIFKILLAADNWISLPFILEACSSENPTIRELANKGLERWLTESNRYFIQPTLEQKMKANSSLSKFSENVDQKMKRVLEFILR